ncbi:Stp1/IreP family PP2C-type Ser/Thr phosphatase [Zhaonella formicivorans]|uniref:Stp1/IreP family PP2C-type Ser/Thr phosphatase n=1 Tax=Zhaonella formicivorans TaxID=2528593 RepID=UPI0010F107AC|nr:Stp1/IreP family PP2C-type Ser/Thr phosphatase [Zhaonella formicivorans]
MRAAARSEAGLVRKSNEDFFLCDPAKGLYIVADGMGGHLAGEVASQMAIKVIADYLDGAGTDHLSALKEAVTHANARIYSDSQDDLSRQGMGTTLTSAWIVGSKLYLAHVGDSRAYLIRKGSINLLTCDHSYVGELLRNGGLTEEEAQHHPRRNVLMRAVGADSEVDIDLIEVNLEPGDHLLLCTDGLFNLIPGEELLEIILRESTLEEAVNCMVDLAYSRGAGDNLTVILVQYP